MPVDPLSLALFLFGLALPLSVAGANIGWGLTLAALLWKVRGGWRPGREDPRSALEIPLWFFLGAAILSIVLGTQPSAGLHPLRQDLHKLWIYYLLATAFAAAQSRTLLYGLFAGFLCAALVGIGQSFFGLLHGDGLLRAHAFVHPVTFGEQVGIGLLAGICWLVSPDAETSSGVRRRCLWVWAGLLAAALLLSNTRGAALGAAAGLAVLFPYLKDLRRWSVYALGLVLAGLLFMEGVSFLQGRSLLAQMIGYDATTPMQFMRISLWDVALRMGRDHLWTGAGPAQYRALFPQYFTGFLDGGERTWGTAHNLYLHHFAERGIVGLGALFLLLGSLWYRAFDRVRRRPGALNLWAYGTTTAFLVMNLTEVALQVELVWMLVWTVWLLAEAEHRRSEREVSPCP